MITQNSVAEGFGLTVVEAMWKGRPVVGSAVGGIQDQLVDGDSGLLLPAPRDLDAFGDALVRLLADPALASRLGRAAQVRARTHFLGSRHLLQYAELFSRLVAQGPAWTPAPPVDASAR